MAHRSTSRRPAYRPRLEGIESRLAPSAAPLAASLAQPYMEQDNLYKQVKLSIQ
jgi:hypothetical protein